jgi:pimeloyl-ACP methyl ester carboxylesterase
MTAPVAYGLNDSRVWALGSEQFFSSEEKIKSDIYFTQPYQPGRIPVIFVHGTMSSPVWWAEMWNTLRADPELRDRCQFWNFIYNSGKPFTKSAADLRQAIEKKVRQLDPAGQDPALRQMVVIGHSQGGLLAKLTATETGDQLWRAVSDKDFATLPMKPEDREMLRRYFFFQPAPSVTRVVFVSTPHRGSYLAVSFVRKLARRFMSLPADTVRLTEKLLQADGRGAVPSAVRKAAPTSLDQMSPKNKLLLKLAEIPVAPGVRSHSIIAINGDGPPEKGGDGVVKYTSAHVPYTESEFIVRSGHSCQEKPPTIEEVRRILLEHLAELPPAVKQQQIQSSALRNSATSTPK